jgi:hypothetical protein
MQPHDVKPFVKVSPTGARGRTALEAMMSAIGDDGEVVGELGQRGGIVRYPERAFLGGRFVDLWVTGGLNEVLPPGYDRAVELCFFAPPDAGELVVKLFTHIGVACQDPANAAQGQMIWLGHTIYMYFDEWVKPDPELAGFAAVLFDGPSFIPIEDMPLKVFPDDGSPPTELLPLVCIPITKAEWEYKREHGYVPLVTAIENRFPALDHRVLARRESAL